MEITPDPGLLIVAHLAPGRSVIYGLSRIEQKALYREDTVAAPSRFPVIRVAGKFGLGSAIASPNTHRR
jgi:hypothetical protein